MAAEFASPLLLVLPLLAMTCGGPRAELPLCTTTVSQEPSGDLAADLVGAWKGRTGSEDWHHPIAFIAAVPNEGLTGDRIWMFRGDGTGHVWWALNDPGTAAENDEEFTWNVVDGELVVNDLPPATIDIRSPTGALIHPIDESIDPLRGVGISRCDLSVPEGVEDFNA